MKVFRNRRREQLRKQPFPPDWQRIITRNFPLYHRLSEQDRHELHGHVNVFLDEKRFEGCAGFEVTDEVRVTIAAQACLLLLHRETDYFPKMETILVYPAEFEVEDEVVEEEGWVVTEYVEERSGESWSLGPVVLSWEDVCAGASWEADGYNVVLHEFTHQLDLENDAMDGVPKLDEREYEDWVTAFNDAYQGFVAALDAGRPVALDEYAAGGPTEFFAVAVEAFFETPEVVREHYPDVYEALANYFQQNPGAWPEAAQA